MSSPPDHHVDAVEKMKAHVAGHLHDPITLKDLAGVAGFSQFHTSRVFKSVVGITPFEYVRQQRLTAAARDLRSGGRNVIDVALDFVFDSHEGFTRAFSKGFGIAPGRFRSYPVQDGWLIPVQYRSAAKAQAKEQIMTQASVIFTQIIERPTRKLILKRSVSADNYFAYTEETGCDDDAPWNYLVDVKEALYEPVGLWLPKNMQPDGTGVYAHGVEVPADFRGDVPAGFDVLDLPASIMIVFQGEPYDDENYQDAVGACMERIQNFNPEVYGYTYAPELAPRMQLAPEGWRGYIEMKPVKPL